MSLLLLTVTLRGVSNKHCLLSLFHFNVVMTLCSVFFARNICNKLLLNVYNVGLDSSVSDIRMVVGLILCMRSFQQPFLSFSSFLPAMLICNLVNLM